MPTVHSNISASIHPVVRLLLVEDDPRDADFLEEILQEGGPITFSVSRATTLDAAQKVVEAAPFDIVILDLNLPDSRGLETLSQFRQAVDDGIPIFILAEDHDGPFPDELFAQGDNECLVKGRLDYRLVPRLLRHSLERQRAQSSMQKLISTNPDGMVVVNFDGVVLFANRAAADLFSRSVADLLDQQFGYPVVGSGTVEVDIGRERIAEMRVVDIDWLNHPALLTTLRDITEHKRTERRLREAKLEADLANRTKSHFLACMSHELRTPLNAILGFSEMIKLDMLGPDSVQTCRDYADAIHSSGEHLLEIVNDILDVAAVEAGRIKLEYESVDIGRVVLASMRMVSTLAMHRRVHLFNALPPSIALFWGDYRRIQQITVNLLSNAIKYTPPEGKVTVASQYDNEGCLRLVVTDTGIGIEKEDVELLMMPFSRAGNAYTRHKQGTGLGLYISRLLAEMHGGSLHLESTVGVGTSATLILPQKLGIPYQKA